MTTAGNTAHAEGRVLTKSDPVVSVAEADLAAMGMTRATAPGLGERQADLRASMTRKGWAELSADMEGR